jgi:TolB-like protein/DNA-binding winged helix-turn-helix (wHTH) protein/Flp pilus assembly protein TadD
MGDRSELGDGDGRTLSGEGKAPVRFAGLILDLAACTLARESGNTIALTHGEFALLRVFVSRPGRALSRDMLLDATFRRQFEPFDRSVDVLVGRLRRKIEPDPKEPRLIVTVPGEGYRFDGLAKALATAPASGAQVAEVHPDEPVRRSDRAKVADESTIAARRRETEPRRLSIVVLPFANIGGGSEQEHFVDGVTESLTTDLSRIRGAVVIGRNTAFTYKGKAIDLVQIGRELNVRYVLEGSVQRAGNRTRVNAQLIDAETGNHLWAERFDKPLADLFDMQDEIVARLANALNVQLAAAEAQRAEQAPNPDTMDLYFQGLAWLNKGRTPDNVARARSFFDRALSTDPDNVDALIGSARTDHVAGAFLFVTDPAAAFFTAEAKLTRALCSVPDHPGAHMYLGLLQIVTKRAAQGIAECEHALALDRNLADAHSYVGFGKIYIGRAEETEAHIVEALRLSPRDTMAYNWMSYAGIAKNYLGLYDQAIPWFRRAIEANRSFPHPHFVLGVALALLGRLDEARSSVRAGLALNPSLTISRARAAWSAMNDDPAHLAQLERLLDGLRKAGAPEQ